MLDQQRHELDRGWVRPVQVLDDKDDRLAFGEREKVRQYGVDGARLLLLWEGVGACSYLLISFWFTDPANASAGKKAFVTNRIGCPKAASADLGYDWAIDLEEGMQSLIDWRNTHKAEVDKRRAGVQG